MHTLSLQEALNLVQSYWSLGENIEGIKILPSYSDQNFKITTAHASYVFKVANPQWSYADLDLENAALLHLEKTCTELILPKVMLNAQGQHLIPLNLGDEQTCYLRLLTYVEGDVYANVAALKNKTASEREQLLTSLGAAVGKVAYGMREFTHPNAQRPLDWNLMRLPLLTDEVAQLEDPQLHHIVQKHMHYFVQQLPTWLVSLPTSVNHNDANDFNVLVDPHQHQTVCSIIDFGDTCHSFRIADLAITCTYAMQYEDDIIGCMVAILRGYHQYNPLQTEEIKVLYAFIMARLCQSILMANKAYRHNPDNSYILVSQQAVRRLIRSLDTMNADNMTQQFLLAIKSIHH